jgi:hypothetical protein
MKIRSRFLNLFHAYTQAEWFQEAIRGDGMRQKQLQESGSTNTLQAAW